MLFEPRNESREPFASFEDATQYLESKCRNFMVRHFSYWSLSLSGGLPDQVTWIATYDPAYMSYYMGHYTPLGDPAFETGGARTGVVDWSALNAKDDTALAIQEAAARYGIAKHGLSYLFTDGPARNIMFSVNVDCLDTQWQDEKARIIGAFCGFAHYFHGRAQQLVESRRLAA
jgi:Autoinducer binding domain